MKVIMTIPCGAAVPLTKQESMTLTNALNEVVNDPDAIEAWQFATRMGVERSEAQQLLTKINALLSSMDDADSLR